MCFDRKTARRLGATDETLPRIHSAIVARRSHCARGNAGIRFGFNADKIPEHSPRLLGSFSPQRPISRSATLFLSSVAGVQAASDRGTSALAGASRPLPVIHAGRKAPREGLSTKGGKQCPVYLANKQARKALSDYLHARAGAERVKPLPNAPLFRSGKAGAFTPNTMQMLFKRLFVAASLPDASSHSGRRTFATSLIERGIDIKAVSKLKGHGSISMSAKYAEDNPVRLHRISEEVQLILRY